jgi:hypothetical protein
MVLEGTLMGSDALAPAFVHNALDPLEVGGAQCCDVAVRAIDNFGEMRQFDLLGLESKFSSRCSNSASLGRDFFASASGKPRSPRMAASISGAPTSSSSPICLRVFRAYLKIV